MSLYLAICELEFDLRTIRYAFVASSCVFCFIHLKNFESRKNFGFKTLTVLSMLVILGDFMCQFSIIGDKGWTGTGSYQNCFNFVGRAENQGFHNQICNMFKAAYYLNSLVYFTTMGSFVVYLLGTSRLMKLINQSEDRDGCRTQLEDEADLEN